MYVASELPVTLVVPEPPLAESVTVTFPFALAATVGALVLATRTEPVCPLALSEAVDMSPEPVLTPVCPLSVMELLADSAGFVADRSTLALVDVSDRLTPAVMLDATEPAIAPEEDRTTLPDAA